MSSGAGILGRIRAALLSAVLALSVAAAPAFAYADMQGIDVSNWQSGIDISAVPSDFVICKATQGTWYTSPDFYRQASETVSSGKYLGVYHYAEGGDVRAEADHFIDVVGSYIGRAVLVLDWESQDNGGYWQMEGWVKQWCDYVHQRTGVKPMVYCSQSIMHNFAGIGDYGLWIAQYADYAQTGYQSNPWNEGAYGCAIRQYSSTGRLSGYSGNLDLNKAYMDGDAWMAYAAVDGDPSYITSDNKTPSGSPSATAENAGRYTVAPGDCLSAIGAKLGVPWPSIAIANHIGAPYVIHPGQVLTIPGASAAEAVGGSGYIGSSKYIVASGDCLSVIGARLGIPWTSIAQANGIGYPYAIYPGQVLSIAGGSPGSSEGAGRYIVEPGDCLSAIGHELGLDWRAIAASNGISAPYTIYPGQVISY